MKILIFSIMIILLVGCGGSSESGKQKANIFISMGQSNSKGITVGSEDINLSNVYVPIEEIAGYPESITFSKFTNLKINKADPLPRRLINTATEFARGYKSDIPLYLINIAIPGVGLAPETGGNYWQVNRADDDNNSLHPQSIHYIKKVISQLESEGFETKVIGLEWNQWEADHAVTNHERFTELYNEFFLTFDEAIGNTDYPIFICNPTSNLIHKDDAALGYYNFSQQRDNVYIYKPDELHNDIWRDSPEIHYTRETHEKIAEYILEKLEVKEN